VLELARRESDDAVAGRDERGISRAIVLERIAVAVDLVSVHLDHEL
jgi:hypothetical protein